MGLQGVHMISVEMSWVNLCFSYGIFMDSQYHLAFLHQWHQDKVWMSRGQGSRQGVRAHWSGSMVWGPMARTQGSEVKVWGGQGLVRDQVSVVMNEAWWVGRPSGWHRPMAKKSWVRMAWVRAPCLVLKLAWDSAKTLAKAYGNMGCAEKTMVPWKAWKIQPHHEPVGGLQGRKSQENVRFLKFECENIAKTIGKHYISRGAACLAAHEPKFVSGFSEKIFSSEFWRFYRKKL